jgi:predicted membrane channel-forming protein YqfA (hemolysin III family)
MKRFIILLFGAIALASFIRILMSLTDETPFAEKQMRILVLGGMCLVSGIIYFILKKANSNNNPA